MLNNLALWIYLIELTSNLEIAFTFIFIGLVIITIIFLFHSAAENQKLIKEEEKIELIKTTRKKLKSLARAIFVCILIAIFIPSKPTMYTMLGINTLKELVSHPKVDDLTSKSLLLLENKINQLLEIKESN